MDGPRSYGCPARRKRTHDEMQQRGPLGVHSPYRSQSRSESAGPSTMAQERTPQQRIRQRYPGDGLDYRSPARGTVWNPAPANDDEMVIDLTAEDEEEVEEAAEVQMRVSTRAAAPPRFPGGTEIIDLSADTSAVEDPDTNARHRRPTAESPEVVFVRSLPRPPRPAQDAPPRHRRPLFEPADLSEEEDDFEMAEIVDLEALPEIPPLQPRDPYRLPNRMTAFLETIEGPRRAGGGVFAVGEIRQTIHNIMGRFELPNMLDFEQIGFQMPGNQRAATPPPPVYDAPPTAPSGFTRSPQEDDVLICPNCDNELCTGEDEMKRQVWIVKTCGHVYCGECTQNRSKSKRKGKSTIEVEPFSSCVVSDCGSNVRQPKTMVQIFL